MKLTVRFLGTGTSIGVPVIGCSCEVCASTDLRDARTRTAILVQSATTNVVIDTGPDFRQQALRAKLARLDAVLLTHEHRDHVGGLDDIRAYNIWQQAAMPIYASEAVQAVIKRDYHYAFGENPYPGAPRFDLKQIDKNSVFRIGDLQFQAFEVLHGTLPILCFRCGDFTYITDCKTMSDEEFEKIKNTKTLVINALHHRKHPAHFNVEEAVDFINRVKPERAYLIHCSHLIGKYADMLSMLPENVQLSYDGLEIQFDY